MRRKDREMGRAFAEQVLDNCEYAVLSTVNPDGTPYCVPLTIVRAGDCVYFHCARDGQKVQNLRQNPAACLSAVGATHMLLDEFSTEYESAIITGAAEEVTNDQEKIELLRLLCQRHVPANMARFDEEIAINLAHTAVWRIRIASATGKRKKYGPDGKELKFGKEG